MRNNKALSVSEKAELFFTDEDGNEIQLTSGLMIHVVTDSIEFVDSGIIHMAKQRIC